MADKDVGPRIGCDPELFVMDIEGRITPICGLVGGTKDNPIVLDSEIRGLFGRNRKDEESRGHYAMQEDNVMLEFNIPAYPEVQAFCEGISRILYYLETTVLTPKNLRIKYGVVDYAFKADILSNYIQSETIGCDPDYNAYATDGRFERNPYSAVDFGNRRFCGGHIHVQYDKDMVPPHIFAQFMDCVACLPYLSLDKQKTRRLFYGQPGLFRVKDYGVEYRTLSSFWLTKSFREKHLINLADNVLQLARLANTEPERLRKQYSQIDWDEVTTAIRDEDSKKASELCQHLRAKIGVSINEVV